MKKAKVKWFFYKNYEFIWIPYFIKRKLMWKDKFDSPRCEITPYFKIEWLWFGFYCSRGDDQYWEQWLWVNKYYDGDYDKAKENWGWIDMNTKKSTWIDY